MQQDAQSTLAASALGNPVAVFHTRTSGYALIGGVFGLIAGLALLGMLGAKAALPFLGVLASIALGLSAYFLWRRQQVRAHVLRLYAQGLVQQTRTGVQALRLADVVRIGWQVPGAQRSLMPRKVLVLFTRDGSYMPISDAYRTFDALSATIQEQTRAYRMPPIVQQLQRGEWVEFGAIACSQTELRVGKKRFAWSNIASVALNLRDVIEIQTKGRLSSVLPGAVQVSPASVYDTDILFILADRLSG